MSKEEFYKILKNNLTIKSNIHWMGSQKVLTIKILFDGKEISSTDETLEWDDDDF